jgi:thiol-disulfide isomerase/thioredoxin
MVHSSSQDFLVICLCAEWCGSCREYQPGFNALAAQFPEARFRWLDIEEQADALGDLDIENFPTLFIQREESVLFFGTMLPHLSHLQRLIETLQKQTPEQSRAYALSSPERREWQSSPDLRQLARATRP